MTKNQSQRVTDSQENRYQNRADELKVQKGESNFRYYLSNKATASMGD